MRVNIFNQTTHQVTEASKLIKSIFKTIESTDVCNVIFVTDEEIQSLNKIYRSIDKLTDVLSFPDNEANFIGDIFISYDQALRQASDYGHTIEREIGFLATHGYLHLLGYDHGTKEEEMQMRIKQEAILKKANLERNPHGKID